MKKRFYITSSILCLVFSMSACVESDKNSEDVNTAPTFDNVIGNSADVKRILQGSWLLGCEYNNQTNNYQEASLSFSDNAILASYTVHNNTQCNDALVKIEIEGNFIIGDKTHSSTGEEVYQLDMLSLETFYQPLSQVAEEKYNQLNLCQREWQIQQRQNISDCTEAAFPINLYDIVQINNKNLQFGDNEYGDGKSNQSRPSELDKDIYSKVVTLTKNGSFSLKINDSSYVPAVPMLLRDRHNLDNFANEFNQNYLIPKDSLIEFTDCGLVNAYYTFENHSITFCYELFEKIYSSYAPAFAESIDLDALDKAWLATRFILNHELAHLLIDMNNIPVFASEEDVADSIATTLAVKVENNALGAVYAGFFFYSTAQGSLKEYFDVHTYGPQRFGNLACWAAGGDVSILADEIVKSWVEQVVTDGNRACANEFKEQVNAAKNYIQDSTVEVL